MNFYFKSYKNIKKKSFIVNLLLFLRNNKNILFIIFFFIMIIFFSLFFLIKPINYKIIYKTLSMQDNKVIIKNLINVKIPYKYSKISKSLSFPEDQMHILNFYLNDLFLKKHFKELNLFHSKNKINLFDEKINYQDKLEKNLSQMIKKLNFIKSSHVYVNFYKNYYTLDVCNESSVLIFVNIDTKKNIISEDFLDAIISLISMKIPNFPKKNIIILNKFGELLHLKKNSFSTQINYQNFNDVNIIKNQYKYNIKDILFDRSIKKNILDEVTFQNNFDQLNYKNNFSKNKLQKKSLIYVTDTNLCKKKYLLNSNYTNHIFKENKKNYDTIIFSNYDKKHDVKKIFKKTNFYKKKYIVDLNKKKILNLINLKTSNLEDFNNKFDYFKSNLVLDIGKVTIPTTIPSYSISIFTQYNKCNVVNKYFFLVDREIFNIKNLIKEIVECSVLRDNSVQILNCNFIEPETPITPYIPIKKNEFFDRTLHLVPWFILFFFIILLITSFYSFKKLTKKIEDSNMNIIYSVEKYFDNSKNLNSSHE